MNTVKAIAIPEGNVKSIAIGGVNVWNEPSGEITWEQVFASIDAGTYATDYAIGDTVPLDLGTEGVINMQIAAFDTDDLADGSGKAPITWVAKELLNTDKRMNPRREENDDGTYKEGTGSIGGWEKTEMRAYLKGTIKPLMPEVVRNSIKEVTKTHSAYNTAGTEFTQTSIDDVWLPDGVEMRGKYHSMFPDVSSRIKYKVGAEKAHSWRLRSAYNVWHFETLSVDGSDSFSYCQDPDGVAIGFCT